MTLGILESSSPTKLEKNQIKKTVMNIKQIIEQLAEISRANQNTENDELALLEKALFVEDILGITLTDDEISEKNLGTQRAIEKFVLEKLKSNKKCAESAE